MRVWVTGFHGFGFALLALCLGCGSTSRNAGPQPMGWSGAGGSGAVAGAGGSSGGVELEAVPGIIHRLNGAEYRATVADTLGASAPAQLPPDGEMYGFDNIGDVQRLNDADYALYLDSAQQLAKEVFATAALKARVLTCQGQDDAKCVQSVIANMGLRLFRRPVLAAESAAYEKVYAAERQRGELHEGALRQVLVALLASAQFLYRMEFPGDVPGTVPIGAYELASRLSYMLWSSAPDDELLTAAQNDALSLDDELSAQVSRMWDDPKSQRFVTNFAGQWLAGRRVPQHAVAADVYPAWTPQIATAAGQEVLQYFDDFLRQDLDFSGFYTSRAHHLNGSLGKLYGVDVTGPETELLPVTFAEGERQGYVGLVGYLTVTSMDRRTSPMLRGKFILQKLLCLELPPPPQNIPPEIGDPGETLREYYARVGSDPVCGGCHGLMDPFGLALEHYDGIGRYRTIYDDGEPIEQLVTMRPSRTFPEGFQMAGIEGVAAALARDPRSKSCLVQNAYTYGMGHTLSDVDLDNVTRFAQQWESEPLMIKDMVARLALSKPFRFRSDGGLP
jgi:hypothetical protein